MNTTDGTLRQHKDKIDRVREQIQQFKDKIDRVREQIQQLGKAEDAAYRELCEEINVDPESPATDWLFDYCFNSDIHNADDEYSQMVFSNLFGTPTT